MGDWIRLEKGRYINLDNVIATNRGPAGHGVIVFYIDGTSETFTSDDAATIIAELEKRTMVFVPDSRPEVEKTDSVP